MRQPVQLRWSNSWGNLDETLDPFARWASTNSCWYAERWPMTQWMMDEGAEPNTINESRLEAIAIGTGGVIAVRNASRDEDHRDRNDEKATFITSLLGKRAWKGRKCIVPVRIVTLAQGDRRLESLNAIVPQLDEATIAEWEQCWQGHIDRQLAQDLWETLLPRVGRNVREREDILRYALSPLEGHHRIDDESIGRSEGLRSILRALDPERGLQGELLLPHRMEPTARRTASATIESIMLNLKIAS